MRFKRRVKMEKGLVDLTPLINVFFLLFIFFVFTSSFIFQPGIRVSLPRAITSEVIPEDTVAITITKNDLIYLNDRQITRQELVSSLRLIAKQKASLLIKADADAPLGRIVEVWDTCRNEGVLQVSIATTR